MTKFMFWCIKCRMKFYEEHEDLTVEEYWRRNDKYTDEHDCERSMFKTGRG